MDVKEAVSKAVDHIRTLFEHEQLSNLGLEEVEMDDDLQEWIVTVGFSRPWDYPPKSALEEISGNRRRPPQRSYKIVRISDRSGNVLSVKNWQQPTTDLSF